VKKYDLIRDVAKRAGITQAQARACIDSLTETVIAECKANGKVDVRGFGKFVIKSRKPRQYRGPDGNLVWSNGSTRLHFLTSKKVRASLAE